MIKFSQRSLGNLQECHIDLQKVFTFVAALSNVDFVIVKGHRSIKEQQELYAQGRTKKGSIVTNADGVNKKSKHNEFPSRALDIIIYTKDPIVGKKITYDMSHLSYIAGIVRACSQILLDRGEITHMVRWGGNWDSDDVLLYDQKLIDGPHFEI